MQAKTEEGFSEAKNYNLGFSFGAIEAVEMNKNRASKPIPHQKIPTATSTCTERNKWYQNMCVVPTYFILDIVFPTYMILL